MWFENVCGVVCVFSWLLFMAFGAAGLCGIVDMLPTGWVVLPVTFVIAALSGSVNVALQKQAKDKPTRANVFIGPHPQQGGRVVPTGPAPKMPVQ
jgi:hypothetical protein